MEVELLEIKWQNFLAIKKRHDLAVESTSEATEEGVSAAESDPDAAKRPVMVEVKTEDLVDALGVDMASPAMVAISQDADIVTPAASIKFEMLDQNPDGQPWRRRDPVPSLALLMLLNARKVS